MSSSPSDAPANARGATAASTASAERDGPGAPVEALSTPRLKVERRSPLAFLTQDFRLTTGAPKEAERIAETPHIVRGTIEILERLAEDVKGGRVSTSDRRCSIADLPKYLALGEAERVGDFSIEARVSRVQIEAVVSHLRTLGYDAVGVPLPSQKPDATVSYALLAVRGGFEGLGHLREVTEQASSEGTITDLVMPRMPGGSGAKSAA